MIRFQYTTPWEAHWSADTHAEAAWLKKVFTFTDMTDTRHKGQFGHFPSICYLDDVHHRMTHGQVIQTMQEANGVGIQVEIVNPQPRWLVETGPIPEDYLPGIKLRRYQRLAIQVAMGFGHGIVQGGTGAGKTVIMGGCVKTIVEQTDCSGLLVMINSKDLLNQTAKRFEQYGVPAEDIGIVHSDITPKKQVEMAAKRVVFSTHLSISKFPGTLERVQYVICDEAHEVIGPMWSAIFSRLPNLLNVLGFTATPWDNDDEMFKMKAIFGQLLCNIPMKFLIEHGVLMKPQIHMIHMQYRDRDMAACKVMSWQDAKRSFIIEDQNRNLLPVAILKLIPGRMMVIFDELKHGQMLKELYEQHGVPVQLAEGKHSSKNRQAKLDWFAEELEPGDTVGKVLLASKIFNQGIDLDNGANHLFILGAKAKKRIAVQRIGRVLRINSEGWVYIWDCWDSNQKNISRWSGIRRDVMVDLGFDPKKVKPDYLPKIAGKHPELGPADFRNPITPC